MMIQARRRSRALILASLVPLAGCMTTGEGGHRDAVFDEPGAAEKAGSKSQGTAPEVAVQPPGAPGSAPPVLGVPAVPDKPRIELPPAPTIDEQLAFIRRQTPPGAVFDLNDRQLVAQLPPGPAAGSIAEAALALGLIKTTLNPAGREAPTFQEADLGKPGAGEPKKSATPTLEQLCKERNLNLPDALAENPLLSTAGVAKQVMAALAVAEPTAEFKAEVMASLKKQASLWNEVAGSVAPAPPAAGPVGPPPGPAGPPATPLPTSSAAPDANLPPNPAELAGGEGSLTEAQALADRGDYEGAIKRAAAIADGNPLRPQAVEKVKNYSNLAVQELRRKAAAAFQSAMPVTDPRTRAEYLKQAKGFLEEAVTKYPEATQLPTVKDNLRVIGRDLEKLEAEASGTDKKG